MKNIITIFLSDVRGLAKNILALIIAIGLCILPSLYAWFNIYSNWDPYSNTANIKVAAVSEDKGVTKEDGTLENMGQKVLEELETNDKIGWVMAESREQALHGVKSGEYYAAIVIEEDFTHKMYNAFAEDFDNPGITYYENEKKNAVATKITDTAVSTLQQSINRQFIEVVAGTVFEQANSVSGELENSDELKTLQTKIQDIYDMLQSYASVIDGLLDGNQQMTDAVRSADGKIGSLKEKVSDGMGNMQQVESNVDATRTSLDEFGENVNAVLDTVQASIDHIAADISRAELAGKTQEAAENMIQAARDVEALKTQLADFSKTLTGMKEKQNDLHDFTESIDSAIATIGFLDNSLSDMKGSIEKLGVLKEAGIGRSSVSGTVLANRAERIIGYKTEQLTDVLAECSASVGSMKSLYTGRLVPEIQNVLENTSRALDNVDGILESLSNTLDNTSVIFKGVVQTVNGTNVSLEQIKTVLCTVSTKLEKIMTALDAVGEDERVDALLDLLKGNPEIYGEFFSEPVQMETKEVYPIKNYGSAMTPFYTILSLWVGALLLTALIKVKAEPKNLSGVKHYHLYFGRYLLFFVLGQLQTAIVVLGDIYLLKCQILDKGIFWLTAAVASFVFTLLIYTLTLSFGDIGKALAVVMMVIQIAGSGGTFPIELLPGVYRSIYIFFPFPYAINAMRETIGGMYGDTYVTNIGGLLVFAIAALVIGLFVRIPFIKINHFMEKRMEDTKMM